MTNEVGAAESQSCSEGLATGRSTITLKEGYVCVGGLYLLSICISLVATMLNTEAKNWYRDDYMISTEPLLIQVDEVNAVLGSDLMWWAQGLPRDQMKKALHNSLCFGLYALPQSTAEIAGRSVEVMRLLSLLSRELHERNRPADP